MPIYAAAYVTINGNTAVSENMSYSLRDVLQVIDESINSYHEEAPAMQEFISHWSDKGISGETWDFAFQPSQDAVNINTAYADRHRNAHCHWQPHLEYQISKGEPG